MTEDGLVGQGDLGLGLTKEQIEEILGKLDVEKGQYFEDPEFPCGPSALFYRLTFFFDCGLLYIEIHLARHILFGGAIIGISWNTLS